MMKLGGTSDIWLKFDPKEEDVIQKYKEFDPDLAYLRWFWGDECEDLVMPNGHDYAFFNTLYEHWYSVDREACDRMKGQGILHHEMMKVVRVAFSELRRLEQVHELRFEQAMSHVVNHLLLATTPDTGINAFSHFRPPQANDEDEFTDVGAGLLD